MVYKAFDNFYNSFESNSVAADKTVKIRSYDSKNELIINKSSEGFVLDFVSKDNLSNVVIGFHTYYSKTTEVLVKVFNLLDELSGAYEENYQYTLDDVKYLTKKKN